MQTKRLSTRPGLLCFSKNLGGTGKQPTFLKQIYFMDPGNSLLLDVCNLADQRNQGQIVLHGYQPLFPGVIAQPAAALHVWPASLE